VCLITVAIAAVIRIKQSALFYKLTFLRHLTTMQFLSLLSTSVAVGLFERPYRRGIQRILIVTLYGILEFGFYMGLVGSLIASNVSWMAITNLSNAWNSYGRIFPWTKHVHFPPPRKINLPKISAKEYFNPFSKKGWKFSLIIFRLVIAGTVGLILAGLVITALCYGIYGLFHVLRGKTARFLVVLISLGLTIGMLVELAAMERTRNIMTETTGADFQDNQWGFGQVIALFLWMPLCIQLVYYAAHKVPFSTLARSLLITFLGITYSQITNEPNMDDAEKQ
jgi:hypothetical protein